MTKPYTYTGTIIKNTNRLITSSESELSSLREGSFVIIDKGANFYKVLDKEKVLYVNLATVVEDQYDKLEISGEDRHKFCLNDLVTFTHKQHFISKVKSIVDKGKNFKIGDNLKLKSGLCSVDSYDGSESAPEIEVIKVGKSGELEEVKLNGGGIYNIAPDLQTVAFSTSGEDAVLSLEITEKEKRVLEDRVIAGMDHGESSTEIILNHPLPTRFRLGKLSVSKYEVILHINYPGETLMNCHYYVTRDFTPHYGMPLMHVGGQTNESAYNESMSAIDAKLKELEEKINNKN